MRDTERRSWTIGDLGIRLVIFVLAALLLMALQLTGQLRPLQSAITAITSPAQLGATGVTASLSDLVAFFIELRTLRRENAQLKQEIESIRARDFALNEVERQNEQFRRILRFRDQRPGLELRGAQIVARVLGQDSNNFLKFLRIDLGAAQGIRVGMPVVTDLGLVGRISKVEASTADVLLITDVSSAVNARLQNSRLTGVIRGDPGGALLMDFIPQGVDFGRNEVIVTSGLGSSFPSGINIGQVILRIQNDIESAQQATVAPIVNFDALELVAVVTNFNPLDVEPELQAGQNITDSLLLTATETLTGTNILTGTP